MDPEGDRTLAAAAPPRVQFSEQVIPPGGEGSDPYQQDNRLNKSDIEKVIEKRIVGASSDHSDLMILYTARGRWVFPV